MAQRRPRWILSSGFAAIALVGGSACGSDGSSDGAERATTVATTAAAENAVPKELVGTYTRMLTRSDKEKAGAPLGGPPEGLPEGETRLTLEPDGVVFVVHADRGDETIEIEVTADRFEVSGGEYCTDPSANASYRWKTTQEQLTITPIDVDCPDRQAVLDGTWTRD